MVQISSTNYFGAKVDTNEISDGAVTYDKLSSNVQGMFVPIGGIIPFLKSLSGVPSIPSNFLECNGQVVNDADSPLNGVTLPNLNQNYTILYGDTSSGNTKSEDYLPNHNHDIQLYVVSGASAYNKPASVSGTSGYASDGLNTTDIQNKTSGTAFNGYSVVWIIRIK